MSVAEELKILRGQFAECRVVAFADISTKMVFLSDSEKPHPQEKLDRLCLEAVAMFEGAASQMCSSGAASEAVVFAGSRLAIFLRAKEDTPDVLCCICNADIDINTFLTQAQASLARIT